MFENRACTPFGFRLVGEQSNAYRILLRYDRKSRHRRIKKQRRYERLAATSQLSLWSVVKEYLVKGLSRSYHKSHP